MTKNVVHVALFAALIAALGLIPKFDLASGVPITAQSLGVMLAGTVLGAKRGGLAALLFIGLVAAGLPLLSGGRGGLGLFASPSAGFLFGWPVAAFVTGLIVERWRAGSLAVVAAVASVVGGIFVMHSMGIVGMSIALGKTLVEALMLDLAYLPGDLVKAVVAGLLTQGLYRARPESLLSRA